MRTCSIAPLLQDSHASLSEDHQMMSENSRLLVQREDVLRDAEDAVDSQMLCRQNQKADL